jgi:hypothetical protein
MVPRRGNRCGQISCVFGEPRLYLRQASAAGHSQARAPQTWMFELARLAICTVVGAATAVLLCAPAARAAPISATDASRAETSAGARFEINDPGTDDRAGRPPAEDSIERYAEPSNSDAPGITPIDGLFRSREFELSVTAEEYKRYSLPVSCINSESILRRIAGGAEDCPAIKPGVDESEVFNLPFLAICGWILVVLAVAGLHRFYGIWRVWRWLRRMRAQGVLPNTPPPRRVAGRRTRRSNPRGKPRSRRYAG